MELKRKAFFEKEGYLIVEDLLSAEEVKKCQTEIHKLHQFAAGQESDGEEERAEIARRHVQREPFAKDETQGNNLPVLRKAENTRQYSEVFRNLAQHPKLISVVQELTGSEDLLLFRSTLMFKPAFHGSSHGLHQDSAYWPMGTAEPCYGEHCDQRSYAGERLFQGDSEKPSVGHASLGTHCPSAGCRTH